MLKMQIWFLLGLPRFLEEAQFSDGWKTWSIFQNFVLYICTFAAIIILTFFFQGGYFRCNRYEAMHKADEKQGSMISEAGQRNKQLQVFSDLYLFILFING